MKLLNKGKPVEIHLGTITNMPDGSVVGKRYDPVKDGFIEVTLLTPDAVHSYIIGQATVFSEAVKNKLSRYADEVGP